METYLLKFTACLLVFWLVYVLVLERQTMHHFKRFYLLGAIALALIIPTLTITEYVEPVGTNYEFEPMTISATSAYAEIPQEQPPTLDLATILWRIYGLGVVIFAIRFLVNLLKMKRHISRNEVIAKQPFIYVLLQEYQIPHSFFKYIFLNKIKYESDSIPKAVLLHEETHAKQLHSLDIIILELLQIVFWFHPLVYILKHHIKLNHEFLADSAVLKQGVAAKNYQNILLEFLSPDSYRDTHQHQLSSALNYSAFKKRFTIMKTQTSKTRIWLSTLLLLPIVSILFFSFAETKYVEKEPIESSEVLQIKNYKTNGGATEAMMQEYNDWMKKLNSDSPSVFIPIGTWERLAAIHDIMSENQRNSVENHPFPKEVIPNLYLVKPNIPTTTQLESWKNEKEFAIWLDGKHISNSKLNNYKVNDIAHYTGSSVHRNAKSKKHPQPFQFSLYTKEGFNKFYKEPFVKDYFELSKKYSDAIKIYLRGSQIDNSELRIMKAQADKFYDSFTKEEKEKHNILPFPPVPSKKEGKVYQKKYDTPKLVIHKDGSWWINNKKTSIKTLKKDFNSITNNQKSNLWLSSENPISSSEIEKIQQIIGDNLASVDIGIRNNTVYDYQEKPIMSILINRRNQFLVDDEMGTLETIENKLKKLAKEGKAERLVSIKYDKEASKEIISKVEALVKNNKFKVASFDASQIPPPPAPKQKTATKKQIAEYNTWAKKINTAMAKAKANNDVNEYPIVKVKEVKKYKAIFNIMSKSQRENAEPWPNFPPPPPPPPAPKAPKVKKGYEMVPPPPPPPTKAVQYKNGKKKTLNEIIKETPKGVESGYEKLENGESHYYTIHKGEKTYYNKDGYITNNKGKVLPPPPPPPKSGLIKKNQNNNIINPVEITIKKDKSLKLNGELVDLENLLNKVKKLNQHLPFEKRRKYVFASIQVENNDHISFSKNIQRLLTKADIYNCSVGYNETKSKAGLPNNHFNLYSGLTLEEAKAKEQTILNEDIDADKTIDSINNSGGPWKVEVSYKGVEQYGQEHPKNVSKTIKDGKTVEVLESTMDEISYNGKTYSYHVKNDKSGYAFFDKFGQISDDQMIKTLTKLIKEKNKD